MLLEEATSEAVMAVGQHRVTGSVGVMLQSPSCKKQQYIDGAFQDYFVC